MKSDSSIWIFKVYGCNLTHCTWKSIMNWMIRWTSIYKTTSFFLLQKNEYHLVRLLILQVLLKCRFWICWVGKILYLHQPCKFKFYNKSTVRAVFSVLSWTILQSCIRKKNKILKKSGNDSGPNPSLQFFRFICWYNDAVKCNVYFLPVVMLTWNKNSK